jgi:hypothetical protein
MFFQPEDRSDELAVVIPQGPGFLTGKPVLIHRDPRAGRIGMNDSG